MREFRISEIDVEKTLAKAQKIASRGTQKGLEGGWKVSIESRSEITNGIEYEYKVLVIEGEPVKYNGWQFVGVAEIVEGKPITKGISGGVEIKASDVKEGYCDHCKTSRQRKQYIFVEKDGKLSQVGSTCVKDYLGWTFYASALVTEDDFKEEFESLKGGHSGVSTLDAMTWAVCAVEKIGYRKSNDGVSTRDLVWGKLLGGFHGAEVWKYWVNETPTDKQIEKAKELIEYGKTFEGDSSYAENVRTVASLNFQKESTIGILVSIIKAKQKSTEIEIANQEKPVYKNEQFASVGERIEIPVKVTAQNTFETVYGWTTLYTFSNGDYQFKWFSSREFAIEVGDEIKIKGTVKGSDEYKGTFSTVLTRCKIA